MEAGASYRQMAEALGLTLGQFRYRLQKYRKAMEEIAVTQAEPRLERPEWKEDSRLWEEEWVQTGIEDRLILMAKDPWTLFAHWRVSPLQQRLVCRHFESEWGRLPFSLRLCDVTDLHYDGKHAHSIRVENTHPLADRYWLAGVTPGRHYLAEWGTWTLEGHFFTLLCSNVVKTPRILEERNRAVLKMEPVASEKTTATTDLEKPFYPDIADRWNDRFDGYTWVEKKEGDR
ncbi:hypothetical protein C8J48_0989 [Desmospora activa DSM 45169]|uniref:DUF4912 domain-containing protein n=1 Tax=Desmospora activa DSM 45169 TaxID=1121389 RepID=A0A2T4Z939_9BACL|nr:hypothetical protein C8J48_0989 [Desmospora activa DSM 45169]